MECGLLGPQQSLTVHIFCPSHLFLFTKLTVLYLVALQSSGGSGKQLVPASLINYNPRYVRLFIIPFSHFWLYSILTTLVYVEFNLCLCDCLVCVLFFYLFFAYLNFGNSCIFPTCYTLLVMIGTLFGFLPLILPIKKKA